MLINTTWLLDYLEPHCTAAEIIDALTPAGLEVEEMHDLSQDLRPVVIGFVRDIQPLPDAAGMHHAKIETTKNHVIDVVCASEDEVKAGWGVPVATAGTVLPSGVEIKAAKYHGVDSAGMICLDGEMGLVARTTGLQVFEDESLLGKPLPEAVDVSEFLVDLAILPNRPDCLGMIGIAREIAAVLGLQLKYPVTADRHLKTSPQSVVPVHLDDPQLCPRYLGQVIRNVKVGPSPHWLKSRLLTAGKRPINNVVDVTNFVLLEWGQPLHAFDLDQLHGPEIRVRRMQKNETLQLLDETEINGETQPLIIADAQRPVALAGIMGGAATQTTAETADLLLEAAFFDPVTIRSTSKQLDVRSDSSYRFERGTDPNRMLIGAATRAAELIVELAGGELDGDCTQQYPSPRQERRFALSTEQFTRCLGMPVEAETIRSHLEQLEMTCDTDLQVSVPTWRADVNDPVALIEDVARLVGYDAIPLQTSVAAATAGKVVLLDRLRQAVADAFVAQGFLECRTPPLTSAVADVLFTTPAEPIQLQNPMRQDMVELRRSLLPSVLEVVARNARRGAESFRYFVVDRIFRNGPKAPVETWSLGMIAGGPVNDLSWQRAGESLDFFHVKGIVENVIEQAGLSGCRFTPATRPGLVAGQTASITHGDVEIGILGAVDPSLVAKGKLRIPLFAAELNLEQLLEHFAEIRAHRGLPRTPAVTRDLAVILPNEITFADIDATVRSAFQSAAEAVHGEFLESATGEETRDAQSPRLEQFRCIDHYRGKPIPAGRKSLALRLVFRDPGRTLTSDESQQLIDAVVAALTEKHQAQLRG